MAPWLTKLRSPDGLFALFCAALVVALVLMPTGFEGAVREGTHHAKARVLRTDDSGVKEVRLIKTGTQVVTAVLRTGPHRGQTVEVTNELRGAMELDEIYRPGHSVLVEYATAPDGVVTAAYARGRYRLDLTLGLLAAFGVALLAVAGMTGLKALLSFVLAALMLWKVLYPMVLRGHDPIVVALLVSGALVGTICLLVGGFSRKGLVAVLGSALGLGLTCGLALVLTRTFAIDGAVLPFAPTLLFMGHFDLSLTRLFMASIFIAASGAMMDVAMDIAASMDEVFHQRPAIGLQEHVRSGLAVGKAVVGTMTTTLLLAYFGAFSAMMMVFMGQGVPLVNAFNLSHVSAEVLHTLVGSLGLVTVAPFTAIAGGLVYHRWGAERVETTEAAPDGKAIVAAPR